MPWLAAATAVVGVMGSLAQGSAQAQAANANATAAREDAMSAQANAAEEARRVQYRNDDLQSTARATAGGQGSAFEGSPMMVFLENAKQAELQRQDVLYGGEIKSRALLRQAKMYEQSASAAKTGAIFSAASSLGSSLLKGFGGGPGAAAAPTQTSTYLSTRASSFDSHWGGINAARSLRSRCLQRRRGNSEL